MTEKNKKKVERPSTIQETLFEKYVDKASENKRKGFKSISSGLAILDMRKEDKKAIDKLKKRTKLKGGFADMFVNEVFLKPKPPRKPQTLDFLKPRNKRSKPQNLIT